MELYWSWAQDNLLTVVTIALTLVLTYHYLIERDTAVKLSKRYRNSIFEAQSKIFLNATQYLISGNKDLAIKEFLNAVDINSETIEAYFALGGLFRSNGEIEKAIGIHRSLMAREDITESMRVRALKELALDFDKGGFVDKAIETYKDVLKVNPDQYEVIQSLCWIYENIEDWEQAYHYRIMLSKVGHINQAETISHILVQKAKRNFERGDFTLCREDLDEAFRFSPSVSAKILRLRLSLVSGDMDNTQFLFIEFLKEHPMYTSFLFISLEGPFEGDEKTKEDYKNRLEVLRNYFLDLNDRELLPSPSILISKVRLFKYQGKDQDAYDIIKKGMQIKGIPKGVLNVEYIKLLIELNKKDEALKETKILLENLHESMLKHYCRECGYDSDDIFWKCPQCHDWDTIQFRWKI